MLRRSLLVIGLILIAAVAAHADGILIPGPIDDIRPDTPYFTVKYHHVQTEVKDQVATTYVDQVFVNEGGREMEATYIFPLPAGAVIKSFTLHADGQAIEARLLDKEEAQRTYEEIVRKRRDPALLTYAGNNLYKAQIYPIPAGGERRIEIRYSEVLPFDSGLVSYVYPMSTEKFSKEPIKNVTFTADIQSAQAIGAVYSPSHDVKVTRDSDNQVHVSYEVNNSKPDRDLILYYNVATGPVGINVITFKEPGEDGFFLLLAAPTVEDKSEAPPRDICFVIDVSGSMSGQKIEQVKDALTFCVNALHPVDRFNIIAFSDTRHTFADGLQPASAENVVRARAFIKELEAGGGTDINRALRQALADRPESESYYIVFLTDGQPTVGEHDPEKIIKNMADTVAEKAKPKVRLFAFGAGYDVNTHLLDKLSQGNGGLTTYVRENESIETKVSSFFAKISRPMLMNLAIEYDGVDVHDTYPDQLPDLFHGSQLMVLGRYRPQEAYAGVRIVPEKIAVVLSGDSAAGRQRFEAPANFPDRAPGAEYIASLWAARRIGFLLDEIRLKGENRELVDEVVKLSREYGILTEYTAFLALEPEALRAEDAHEMAMGGFAAAAAPGQPMSLAGASAVAGAQNNQAMKAQEQATFNQYLDSEGNLQQIGNIQQVGQRGFAQRNGRWEDLRYTPDTHVVLQVQAYSEAYFQLSRAFPELNSQLAVGDNMLVYVNNQAVEVGAQGKTQLSDADLEMLRRGG